MTQLALFHSVLGVRPGVHAAADLLRSHGHDVRIVDQYDGRVFDNYELASAFATEQGYPALMQRAAEAVEALDGPFVAMGFSNGGAMAQFVASQRPEAVGVVLLSGAIDPVQIGVESWPARVGAQVHYTVDDPFRNEEWLQAALTAMRVAGAEVEQYDYPGKGHLFTDSSLLDEYQPVEAELLWTRVLPFVERLGASG